jgi:hypothetical protein
LAGEEMSEQLYGYGDHLRVRIVPGRIEREHFVVQYADRVTGGGWRYEGYFPGDPELYGKVYDEDIIEGIKQGGHSASRFSSVCFAGQQFQHADDVQELEGAWQVLVSLGFQEAGLHAVIINHKRCDDLCAALDAGDVFEFNDIVEEILC